MKGRNIRGLCILLGCALHAGLEGKGQEAAFRSFVAERVVLGDWLPSEGEYIIQYIERKGRPIIAEEVAAILGLSSETRQQLLRAGDLAARFDGNEVVCVLPGADAGEARRFANRLQKRWIIATGAARWRLDLGISTLRAEDTAELWQVAGLLTRALHQMELAAHQHRGEPLEHRRPSAA